MTTTDTSDAAAATGLSENVRAHILANYCVEGRLLVMLVSRVKQSSNFDTRTLLISAQNIIKGERAERTSLWFRVPRG